MSFGSIHERVVRLPIIAGGVVLLVAVVCGVLFSFVSRRVDCAHAECVVSSSTFVGRTQQRVLPASSIREVALPTHESLVLTLEDGETVQIDDESFAFLDPSLGERDERAIEQFIANPTKGAAHVTTGGPLSGLAVIAIFAIAIALIVRLLAFAVIDISTDDTSLVMTAPAENSRHPLAGITDVDVDRAYASLRVLYADGSHQQGAKLGISQARLDDLARRTRELLDLPPR